jgi:chorismate mutase/prephenate dehydratase
MASAPLSSVREAISELDANLLDLLAQRQQLTNEVARTKIQNQIDVRDPQREEQLLVRLIQEGQKLGLMRITLLSCFTSLLKTQS